MTFKRIVLIILDSVGIGASHDSHLYGDELADTLGHTAEYVSGINLPNLERMGLGLIHQVKGVQPIQTVNSYIGKMVEHSLGKDTMTGHWEMMGLYVETPFVSFEASGFPQELIDELTKQTGHTFIGNKAASGTDIIDELGQKSIRDKSMIIYTSADSVLQIAASEEVFGIEELYRVCQIARKITLKEEWLVGRVIARPFIGQSRDNFMRTANRHDYALSPYSETTLDKLIQAQLKVISVGKISDIFNGQGISESYRTLDNTDGMKTTQKILEEQDFRGLVFVNLVDFDSKWGHRRDPEGYAKELEIFDKNLEGVLQNLTSDDLLILTADHGNDPTYHGTDHTREEVPLLVYSRAFKASGNLPTSPSFANIGATILDNFDIKNPKFGVSLLPFLK